ncbi:MFS transporter [Streptomyces antnestii]|uniref:MFS transporter n=2 Tax=Streptomyces antnestii TaxID=2494256 RepID=A0A3S3UBZ8_9ACTN|nr:MFS transporter [Streptomyces sp. San01]RVU20480.1 MFS transporter [Streptomyces sp. San01]
MPVAMAPLAMVFLVRDRPDGLAEGSLLATLYVIGEMVGAPILGTIASPRRLRQHLAAGLAIGGSAFAGVALFRDAPIWLLMILSLIAGAAPAATPGGVQTILTRQFKEADVPFALSVSRVHATVVWSVAPASVGYLALTVAPFTPFLLGALLFLLSASMLIFISAGSGNIQGKKPDSVKKSVTELSRAWPLFLGTAAVNFLVGLGELELVALLSSKGIQVIWAGPLVAGFSVIGVVGTIAFGLGKWPGNHRQQSTWLIVMMCSGTVICAISSNLLPLALGFLFSGLFVPCFMLVRNLALRDLLPEQFHTAGFSVLYASSCVGYVLCGATASVTLKFSQPQTSLIGAAGAVAVITFASFVVERRLASSRQELTATNSFS